MEDCIFCKIVAGDIPSTKVYEDDLVMGILDINPHKKGHTLIIPKKHYENFLSIPEDLMGHFFSKTKMVANAIKSAQEATGMNIFMNAGADAGQDVFHAHTHLVPRHEGDDVYAPVHGTSYRETEAQTVAEKIKSLLS